MKNLAFLTSCLLSIFFYSCCDVSSTRYDLGQLEIDSVQSGNSYCEYTITKSNCEHNSPYYSKGDKICIDCCTSRQDPWPQTVGTNNNCPKEIVFISADGTCEYEATRVGQSCGVCNKNKKGVYKCPNP